MNRLINFKSKVELTFNIQMDSIARSFANIIGSPTLIFTGMNFTNITNKKWTIIDRDSLFVITFKLLFIIKPANIVDRRTGLRVERRFVHIKRLLQLKFLYIFMIPLMERESSLVKALLPEYCIQSKHHFLPWYPYSGCLSPRQEIEWVQLNAKCGGKAKRMKLKKIM